MISLSISDKFHDIIYNETKTKINKLLANEYEWYHKNFDTQKLLMNFQH